MRISLCDYYAILSSLVMCTLCGCEVQINVFFLIFERKFISKKTLKYNLMDEFFNVAAFFESSVLCRLLLLTMCTKAYV